MTTRNALPINHGNRHIQRYVMAALGVAVMFAAGFGAGWAIHHPGTEAPHSLAAAAAVPAAAAPDQGATAQPALAASAVNSTTITPFASEPQGYTVYLFGSDADAASTRHGLIASERKIDGQVTDNEQFVVAGTPDEWREARLLIKQLQLDYGTANVHVVDLRQVPGANRTNQ